MNVRNLFTDDDAVSPVIGVILMVAITVILAAVIGAFVLNIGGGQDTAPAVSIDFEKTGDSTLEANVQSANEPVPKEEWEVQFSGGGSVDSGEDSALKAGHTVKFESLDEGNEVKIVWTSTSTDKTSILASYTF
jgi:flagellin-like protein